MCRFFAITCTAICRKVMLDQLNFVLVILFLNDIIPDDKINIYSKTFLANNTIPELVLVFKLFHWYVFNLWWFKNLLCVFKPHFISYSQNISHPFHTEKMSGFLRIFFQIDTRFSNIFSEGLLISLLNLV